MTVQNGLGAEEVVRRYGDWRVISGVTFISGIRHSDAVVEYELDTETWMGPYAGTATPFELVEAAGELLRCQRPAGRGRCPTCCPPSGRS